MTITLNLLTIFVIIYGLLFTYGFICKQNWIDFDVFKLIGCILSGVITYCIIYLAYLGALT